MRRVIVVGSINMDVVATAERQPRVGETMIGDDLSFIPGGKGANQAVAAARLNARTTLVGRLGDDAFAEPLIDFLRAQKVNLERTARTTEAPTGTAVIVVAEGDNRIVVIPGANGTLRPSDIADDEFAEGDVVVTQLEVPLETVERVLKVARARGATAILNPAPAAVGARAFLGLADIVVLNEIEAGLLADVAVPETREAVVDTAARLRSLGQETIVITLGAKGALAFLAAGEPVEVAGLAVDAVDTTGAGDCFVGALAARIADGDRLEQALEYANLAASLSVQTLGAGPGMPSAAQVAGELATR